MYCVRCTNALRSLNAPHSVISISCAIDPEEHSVPYKSNDEAVPSAPSSHLLHYELQNSFSPTGFCDPWLVLDLCCISHPLNAEQRLSGYTTSYVFPPLLGITNHPQPQRTVTSLDPVIRSTTLNTRSLPHPGSV